MKKRPEFFIYKDLKGEYRWRLVARNKKIVADSGEGYKRRSGCLKAIVRFWTILLNEEVDIPK